MNNNDYKFILIDISNINKDECEKIYDLFSSFFDIAPINNSKYILYEINGDKLMKNYHLNELANVLDEDFNGDINIFESNVINKIDYRNRLIDVYYKYKSNGYMNVSKLVSNILDNDSKELVYIRDIILYSINEDPYFKKIVLAMFKNNLNVSKTADIVYMHRNTVINKLDVIERRTGLDMQSFQDAVVMYILLNVK